MGQTMGSKVLLQPVKVSYKDEEDWFAETKGRKVSRKLLYTFKKKCFPLEGYKSPIPLKLLPNIFLRKNEQVLSIWGVEFLGNS